MKVQKVNPYSSFTHFKGCLGSLGIYIDIYIRSGRNYRGWHIIQVNYFQKVPYLPLHQKNHMKILHDSIAVLKNLSNYVIKF